MPTDGLSSAGSGGHPHRYLALDALRGAAAFAVLFYHLHNLKTPDGPASALNAFDSGYLAVDLFFVLSGFVISHAYEEKLRASLSVPNFMIARFIRLQPVIAIGTLAGFAVALSQRLLDLDDAPGFFAIATSLPANLLILPNVLVPWGIFLFNPPAWSLFYELAANAVYAFGIRTGTARKSEAETGRRIDRALTSICFAGLAGLAASVVLVGNLDRGVVLGDWPVALARIAFSFALGLLLHRTRRHWMARVPRIPMPWLMLACLTLLAPAFEGAARAAYDLLFVLLLSPALVMLSSVTKPTMHQEKMAAWLGMISYPLYAIHVPIKHIIETVLPPGFRSLGLAPPGFVMLLIITACSAVGAAWLIGSTIDPALRRWLSAQILPLHAKAVPTPQPPQSHGT
ncbi:MULTISPECIES: acyltransferase [unclassified Novosphingobium]|uniref:acyltransferase family protein n=1 Tax=unclassified Novosphingobium TaxID=2644732 RepID=UPI001357F2E6|nr:MULTISPECIES: acyltransferase [unclassified Novosphingobium]